MAFEGVAKEPRSITEDSILCGMTLRDFFSALTWYMFPGYIGLIREDLPIEDETNDVDYIDRLEHVTRQIRTSRYVKTRTEYRLIDIYGHEKTVPEYEWQDVYNSKMLNSIDGVSYHAFSKHPDFRKAMVLCDIMVHVQKFLQVETFGFGNDHTERIRKCHAITAIKEFDAAIKTGVDGVRESVMASMKFITAYAPTMVFVDALAEDEKHKEAYVELVQFIHEYLTQQDNTAKFEL